MKHAIALILIMVTLGCTQKPLEPVVTPTPTPKPTPNLPVKISWESKDPKNVVWSLFVADMLRDELLIVMDKAKDTTRFCTKYKQLDDEKKIVFWTELIARMAYHESGWNPLSRMHESTLGIDPVTGKPVYSEGLLQLSYQDAKNYGSIAQCRAIDWSKDKHLEAKDPKKTILDPFNNLDCGVRILARQIKNKGSIVLSSGVYWSVIKEGGKYSKIKEIVTATKKLPFCE